MKKQVALHNEVILIGRILSKKKYVKCNNKDAIKIRLAIPNDDNYDLKPNIAQVYIYDDNEISKKLNISSEIAINGHIESNWNQRIIADVISLIN